MLIKPIPLARPVESTFAVEVFREEDTHAVAKVILEAAQAARIFFRELKVVDTIDLVSITFVRVRTDLPDPGKLVEKLFTSGRGVIHLAGGQYVIRLRDGRQGKTSTYVMHGVARPGKSTTYRATKIQRWQEQFAVVPKA